MAGPCDASQRLSRVQRPTATCAGGRGLLGEQVPQPLQFGGTGLQVRGELGAGPGGGAVQGGEQRAVVVGGAAELPAGPFGQRERQPLLGLKLGVEAAQPRTAGGLDQSGVEQPVAFEHARGVTAGEGVLDPAGQVFKPR